MLVDSLHARELAADEAVLFLRAAFDALSKRVAAAAAADASSRQSLGSVHGATLSTLDIGASATHFMIWLFLMTPFLRVAHVCLTIAGEVEGGAGLGRLVPLHTGHNGWPAPSEIESLRLLIAAAGVGPIQHGLAAGGGANGSRGTGHNAHHVTK